MRTTVTILLAVLGTAAGDMWINHVEHGRAVYHDQSNQYQVFRNVMDYGCAGDGVHDDTDCINEAISSGGRCGPGCGSSTESPAVVFFPPGVYMVSRPVQIYYYTLIVGDATDSPTVRSTSGFNGNVIFDADPDWFTPQVNFFRQIRNVIFDLTYTPADRDITGIHWQVSQATSLVNLRFYMSPYSQHRGIRMDSGSGGFLSDIGFEGGAVALDGGNQQFLCSDLTIDGADTGILMNWNWEFTFKNIHISNSRIGIDMSNSGIGSLLLVDSSFDGLEIAVYIDTGAPASAGDTSGTLYLENIEVNNVYTVVQDHWGDRILVIGGSGRVENWGHGSVYQDWTQSFRRGDYPVVSRSPSLLDSDGKFYRRTRPQYADLPADNFASVKAGGAQGNGETDDSDAIQNVINQNANGKVVYFPAGVYIIGKTITIPPGSRLIGEAWPVLLARGDAFQDESNPQPMLKVGQPGDSGEVEITEFIFATKGAQPGAILVQWNLRQSYQGSAGMWDCHFRVGGSTGTDLQPYNCWAGSAVSRECIGAHTMLHLTPSSSGLFENIWAWTSDHDLDQGGQISIYTGRGVLIQSSDGPVWLYAVQSEHNVMYQYQVDHASNVFFAMIQSETPYYQPAPPAPQPFTPNSVFNDPTYSHCAPGDNRCPVSYALRIVSSNNVFVYGAGMYNFFSNYNQDCMGSLNCQTSMVGIEDSRSLYLLNINTLAAVNMIVVDNTNAYAYANDNRNGFCQTINAVYM